MSSAEAGEKDVRPAAPGWEGAGGGDHDEAWDAQVDEVVALASIYGAENVAARLGGAGVAVDEDGAALREARAQARRQRLQGGGDDGDGVGDDGGGGGGGGAPLPPLPLPAPSPLLEAVLLVQATLPPEGVVLVVCPARGEEKEEEGGDEGRASPGGGGGGPSDLPRPHSPPAPPPRVHHLPPLALRAVLPTSYPSSPAACPAGTVSAPWLPAAGAAALEAGLAAAWAGAVASCGGGCGGPVLWEWAERARAEAVAAAVAASGTGCGGGIDLSAAAAAASAAVGEAAAAAAECGGGRDRVEPGGCDGGGGGDADAADGDPLAAAAALVADLLRHDADAEAAAFAATTHACPICLEEVPGARCVRPGVRGAARCGHALCAPCAVGLVRAALGFGPAGADGDRSSGTVAAAPSAAAAAALVCPLPGCGARLDRRVYEGAGLLAPAESAAWEAADLKAALAAMPDLVHCPHCGGPTLADPGDHLAVCGAPACRFAFCGLCLGAWHPASPCMGAAARLAVFKARMAGARPTGGQLAELRRREAEYLSAAAIERSGAKRCPGCGSAIQRSEGCNKMSCPACGTRFCYRCGEAIGGYDHFRAGGCILFEAAELARWERAVGGGGVVMPAGGLGGGGGAGGGLGGGVGGGGGGAAAAGLGAAADRAEAAVRNQFWAAVGADGGGGPPRLPRCPRCGQGNARVGRNNHACCFACRGYFCAACGESLPSRGGGLHFGKAPKCQQHS